MPLLLFAALGTIYIVLGILYESYIHPITILSTLPSAGIGAMLALMMFHIEFSLIAAIGVILLIGIVKKNAILMIDFALDAERTLGLDPREAIFEACIMRFRPIMMTTRRSDAGRPAPGAEFRQRQRIASPVRHFHRWRPDGKPSPDALHDTGRVSLPGSLPPIHQTPMASDLSRSGCAEDHRVIPSAMTSRSSLAR